AVPASPGATPGKVRRGGETRTNLRSRRRSSPRPPLPQSVRRSPALRPARAAGMPRARSTTRTRTPVERRPPRRFPAAGRRRREAERCACSRPARSSAGGSLRETLRLLRVRLLRANRLRERIRRRSRSTRRRPRPPPTRTSPRRRRQQRREEGKTSGAGSPGTARAARLNPERLGAAVREDPNELLLEKVVRGADIFRDPFVVHLTAAVDIFLEPLVQVAALAAFEHRALVVELDLRHQEAGESPRFFAPFVADRQG